MKKQKVFYGNKFSSELVHGFLSRGLTAKDAAKATAALNTINFWIMCDRKNRKDPVFEITAKGFKRVLFSPNDSYLPLYDFSQWQDYSKCDFFYSSHSGISKEIYHTRGSQGGILEGWSLEGYFIHIYGVRCGHFAQNRLKMPEISCKVWKQQWGMKGKYARIVQALIDMGYLIVRRQKTIGDGKRAGSSYNYGLTTRALDMLEDENREYIRKLLEPEQRRKIQKKLSRKDYTKHVYPDPVLQAIKSNIDGIDNYAELQEAIQRLKKKEKRVCAGFILTKLQKRDYKDLEIHPETGRVYNPISQLPKEVKKRLRINGQTFTAAIDIRSCINTFFGLHIGKIALQELGSISPEMAKEIESWNTLFCSDPHPRNIIANAIKDEFRMVLDGQEAKDALNFGLNGCCEVPCKHFRDWIKAHYPKMYRLWRKRDIRQTGSALSKCFEGPIFRSEEVVNKAVEMGVIHVDNHDELLLYGDAAKVQQYLDWFVPYARKTAGIPVQFSVDHGVKQEKAA